MASNPKTLAVTIGTRIIPGGFIVFFLGVLWVALSFYFENKDVPQKIARMDTVILAVAVNQYKMCVSLQKDDPNLACTIPVVGEDTDHVSSN